ncbi:hypothetical protein G8764_05325 [Pseudomaricurvus alcaniphilus]|uniref:dienelactone hydrolase family protein n=1 Tax=Pseudomaricurvus alcaniphilus TaxID=1166482 RepID=UPI0014078D0F|nr:acetylxylan esterase [Pseudomaricurvus alcaniphilus]NHN36710.1 hypothetical protein [Pseudomaricurvus alcaniphilus]
MGWLDAVQTYRHRPDALPELPVNLNSRSGLRLLEPGTLPFEPQERLLWREQVRSRILDQINGPLITGSPVRYRVEVETERNGLLQQHLTLTGFDGQLLPARLFMPVAAKNSPAVLLVPGHVGKGESGLLQLTEEPQSYQHAAARALAAAGFVTLVFELRGFGYLGEPEFPEHRAVAYNALQRGESYKSLILKDTATAMALLRQLPQVDAARTAIAGASYGGEIAVQYAALDEQVAAVSFHSYAGGRGRVGALAAKAELPHLCHIFPAVDDWMAQEHWFWLLAPRPVQGIRGQSNQKGFVERHELYASGWENKEELKLELAPGGHEFFVDSAVAFFKARL